MTKLYVGLYSIFLPVCVFSENLIDHFRQQKKLKISQVNSILAQIRKKLEVLPNIIDVTVIDGKELTIMVLFLVCLIFIF
jgi:hypothetical protein